MSMRNDLPYVVECMWVLIYEPIAAFNCMEAAEAYARQCVEANKYRAAPLTYRVCYGDKKKVIKL